MFMRVAELYGLHVIAVVKRDEQVTAARRFGASDVVQITKADDPCTISKLTTFITTSPVARAFISVCLIVLSRTRRDGEKTKIGGLALNRLKKLNGDKFGFPFSSTVLAKAIGRGPTEP